MRPCNTWCKIHMKFNWILGQLVSEKLLHKVSGSQRGARPSDRRVARRVTHAALDPKPYWSFVSPRESVTTTVESFRKLENYHLCHSPRSECRFALLGLELDHWSAEHREHRWSSYIVPRRSRRTAQHSTADVTKTPDSLDCKRADWTVAWTERDSCHT